MSITNIPEIVYPTLKDKHEVAKIWQDVFHDSDEYIDLFFHRVYKPENTLVIKRNRFIASALQMIPYNVQLKDKIIPAAYVCGVCTHPLERGKGLMRNLMQHAMAEMRRRDYGLAILIPADPWLFNFYKEFGFIHPINHRTVLQLYDEDIINVHDTPYTFESCTNEHYPYFDRKQHEREKAIIHDAYDFETILLEMKSEKGETIVAFDNNIPVGMAFVKKNVNNTVLIKEIFADNKIIYHALQRRACQLYHVNNVTTILPETHSLNVTTYGLACILDDNGYDLNDLYMSLMLD
jgi:predicted acetyltransferase